jgi:hypothetical protein
MYNNQESTDLAMIFEAEGFLKDEECNHTFKWKIPSSPNFFMWKKCLDTKSYRLFIIQDIDSTPFIEADYEVKEKYTPFLEEFIAAFKVYNK